jgi:DNA polymerase-3 subunit epsilon
VSLEFVALDVETANSNRGSICAVGWAVVRSGEIVNTGSSLCRPPDAVSWFDPRNSRIHKITERDVADKPRFEQIIPRLIAGFSDLPVVAHNAAFDIGALREAYTHCGLPWPTLSYGCTLVWSRGLLRLASYRLPLVCYHLGIPLDHDHDPGDDARAAAQITIALAASHGAHTIGDLLDATWSNGWNDGRLRDATSRSLPLPRANLNADPGNPFYGQTVVFTGDLSCMDRDEARHYVAEAGGTPEKNVTKRTTLLVLGDGFRGANTLDDLLTTEKALKAKRYRENGQRIEFWSEVDFVEALTAANVASDRTPRTPSPTYSGDTVVKQPSAIRQPSAAPQPQRSVASGAADGDVETETLICFDCGARWQRPRSRSRRPGLCAACSVKNQKGR